MPTLSYVFNGQKHVVPLRAQIRIGREPDNDVAIDSSTVSRHHALISRQDGGFVVADLGSANKIIHNDVEVLTLPLRDGMRFSIGEVEFKFIESDGSPVSAPRPATAAAAADVGAPRASEDAIAALSRGRDVILEQLGTIIIGQRNVLNEMLVALFARGHCLIIGVPGLAKTLMVRSLASSLALDFKRIQFTPDLMPSDIIGTDVLEENREAGTRAFRFHRGPLFASILLADEINRTPPKTQAALLEAMQEHRVTASGATYPLPEPFMVLATQNPIEQEGTYPLPEAQLDRFMFCVHIHYPGADDEQRILLETTRGGDVELQPVLNAEAILRLQKVVRDVPVSPHVALYATKLIRATRPGSEDAPDFIGRWVRWGAGTRAGQYLLLAAKAHVLLAGRTSVSCADIREYALPVLRHRIFTNFAAASEGITPDDIVKRIVEEVKEPAY
jgi:MoxR-like ATPase